MYDHNKGKTFDVTQLSDGEFEALLKHCNRRLTGPRDRYLLIVGYNCGLRASELCNLKVTDIDLSNSSLVVQHGKGNKRRMIGLNLLACEAIRSWLYIRPSGSDWLFPSGKGERLNTSYLRRLCQRLKVLAGITKRVHPHCLRHSFATKASDQLPLRVLSAALGHDSVATTDRYIAKLNPQEVIAAMAERKC